jgi:aminoglycoside 6'-N-acetyltransferase I
LTIRAARPADAAELVRLSNGLFPGDAAEEAKAIAQYFEGALEPATMLVAERAPDRLAGYVLVGTRPYAEGCESSPVAYIEAWYVDEDVRRTGVGRALFAAAEDWGRGLGLSEIASDALIANEVSIAAHRALGYEEVVRIVCFRRAL